VIHAFNFCGYLHVDLRDMMRQTFEKYCPMPFTFRTFDRDAEGYNNGGGWIAAMLKFQAFKDIAKEMNEEDWIVSIDSDVAFTSDEIFKFVLSRPETVGITGILQVGELAKCALGDLHNFSGCLMWIRGSIAKKMAAIEDTDSIRAQFIQHTVCENEDVVLSYIAQLCGAHAQRVPFELYNSHLDPNHLHDDILLGKLKSFYHLQYWEGQEFLGHKLGGKWEIPGILKSKGIEL
jgi:hypothetical protein